MSDINQKLKDAVQSEKDREKRAEHYRKTHPVQDYHDFTHPAMPKEELEKLYVGPLYINGGHCSACDTFIRSRNKHDYVTCRCGKSSVDGGSHYSKYTPHEKFKPIIVPFDCHKEVSA